MDIMSPDTAEPQGNPEREQRRERKCVCGGVFLLDKFLDAAHFVSSTLVAVSSSKT